MPSVGELERMTQQNAALVEQGSVAAATLHQQAERLAQALTSSHPATDALSCVTHCCATCCTCEPTTQSTR